MDERDRKYYSLASRKLGFLWSMANRVFLSEANMMMNEWDGYMQRALPIRRYSTLSRISRIGITGLTIGGTTYLRVNSFRMIGDREW